MVAAELIPGLHNELAMEILLRMPDEYHYVAMEASSLWKIVLCSDRFHALRGLRSKPGRPALLLLLGRVCYKNTHGLYELDLASASPEPFCVLSSGECHGFRRNTLLYQQSIHFDTLTYMQLIQMRKNSFLLSSVYTHEPWMMFDISSRKWTRLSPLPGDFEAHHVEVLGVLDTRVFVAAYNRRHPYGRVGLSYDYSIDRWDSHEGLLHQFSLDRLQFTFRGQIFIRLDRETTPSVYAFDPVTNRWKEHEHMTKRLVLLPIWRSRVAATHDGTLISATHIKTCRWDWKIQVKQQDEGSFKWCNLLEVLVESFVCCIEYFLFVEENHIFLVIGGTKGTKEMGTREDYVVGQRRLTCVYVPGNLLMDALLIHV